MIPLALRFPEIDSETSLPWYSDINNKRPDYELAPVAGGNVHRYKAENFNLDDDIPSQPREYWRAYVAYDPSELEQFRLFVNSDFAHRGIRALRLRGTKKMGIVTVGEWMNYRAVVKRSEKMKISGIQSIIESAS